MTMTTPTEDDVRSALVRLFNAARESVRDRIQRLGQSYTYAAIVTAVERPASGGWKTTTRSESRNILTMGGPMPVQLGPWLSEEVLALVYTCATATASLEQSKLPFWKAYEGEGAIWPL